MSKVGRPTKYSPELLKNIKEYMNCYEQYDQVVPSIAGLAEHLHVRRETLHVWSHDENKKEFSNMLGDLLAKQERLLINKGLSTEFNSNITKLMLAKHGYSEKKEINQSTTFEDALAKLRLPNKGLVIEHDEIEEDESDHRIRDSY